MNHLFSIRIALSCPWGLKKTCRQIWSQRSHIYNIRATKVNRSGMKRIKQILYRTMYCFKVTKATAHISLYYAQNKVMPSFFRKISRRSTSQKIINYSYCSFTSVNKYCISNGNRLRLLHSFLSYLHSLRAANERNIKVHHFGRQAFLTHCSLLTEKINRLQTIKQKIN